MTSWPGPTPMYGTRVEIGTGPTSTIVITGKITSRGVLHDGTGYLELTLSDADPGHRRAIERAERYLYRLYDQDGHAVYRSPSLRVRDIHRDPSGALVVTGGK